MRLLLNKLEIMGPVPSLQEPIMNFDGIYCGKG